jgi:predicted CXXCH cytochrome family protein
MRPLADGNNRWLILAALICLLVLAGFVSIGHAETKNTCIDCHSTMDGNLKITGDQYKEDIHAQKGFTCAACHGGDSSDESPDAMSPKKGFRGHIEHKQVPQICAKCHGDVDFMRNYNPSLRTDQFSQYQTSVHGKKLAAGDNNVAVCTDCHGLHGIRPPSDPRSKVHPLNIANTCAACHANREKMKPYNISTDQFAGYSVSVHHKAMVERGDLSAPTCTTCHGNHGATPPGVASVTNVCSTCHVFQQQLFDKSPHKAAFAAMGGCIVCHSNHRIAAPNDEMVGTGKDAVCTNCHSSGDKGFEGAAKISAGITNLAHAIDRSERLLDKAENSGVEVGESKLDLVSARDDLTKARVTLHSFDPAQVEADLKKGMDVAAKTEKAGREALAEGNHRRLGLGISLLAIVAVLIGLKMAIREVESKKAANGHDDV